jgi:hypothetical protein
MPGTFFFCHPPYSPDLAPNDLHFLAHLRQLLGGTRVRSFEEVGKTVKDWLNGLVEDFYDAGIQNLITQYKCTNLHGDYAEKLFKVCSNYVKYFFFNFIH